MPSSPGPTDVPDDRPRELSGGILGDEPAFTAEQAAAAAGVPTDQARRLWRALGLPEHGDEVAYTRADVDAVAALTRHVETGLLDVDTVANLARALGQTMARLADWEVATLLQRVEALEHGEQATGSRGGSARRVLDEFAAPFEELLRYAWRRQLAAAVGRMEALSEGEEDLHAVPLTVGFADLVSFTALSNEIGERRVGDLVELFESRCADVVARHGGRVIKAIGDSVLFTNADPVAAYDTAEGIITVIGRDARMPDVRVGLATGSVVLRLGDVFGPPVNLAARLTGVARRNRVIVDAATAGLLPAPEFATQALPERPLRGFGVLQPVAVRRH